MNEKQFDRIVKGLSFTKTAINSFETDYYFWKVGITIIFLNGVMTIVKLPFKDVDVDEERITAVKKPDGRVLLSCFYGDIELK